jgi:hypothetical protein
VKTRITRIATNFKSLQPIGEFARLIFWRPALVCSTMRMRSRSSHLRLPHSEVGWDPLRGDPRFDEIVASLAPK